MKLRKAIKKIVALGTGVTMLGATLFGATAVDLADYPSPMFVKDGVFDGVIVVGDGAASSDVIGAVDIATSLQFASKTEKAVQTTGTAATVVVEGDAYKITESGNPLNIGEKVSDVKDTITDEELDSLADAKITNSKGTYSYNQFVDLPTDARVVYDIDSDQSDDPALYLKVAKDKIVYNYKVSFPTAMESDIDSDDEWDDLENKKLTLLGKEYTIIDTDNSTVELELMGGAVQDTMEEYTSKTFTINGVDYEVEVVAIGGSTVTVILKVNGEVTDKLEEGETFKLNDGTELGIKTLLENEGAEAQGGDIVEFYLGANAVKLQNGNTLEVGGESLDADVTITSSVSGDEVSISSIEVSYNATDDYFVGAGEKLSAVMDSDEADNLFLNNIDFEFASLEVGTADEIKLTPSSDNYKLAFETKGGQDLSFDVFYVTSSGTNVELGEDSGNPIKLSSAAPLSENDRFVLTSNEYSHLMEVDDFKQNDDKVKFKDLGNNEVIEVTVDSALAGEFYLDGNQFTFEVNSGWTDLNMTNFGDDTDNNKADVAVMYTKNGAKIAFTDDTLSDSIDFANGTYVASNTGTVILFEEGKDDNAAVGISSQETDYVSHANFTITKASASADIDISAEALSANFGGAFKSWDSNDDLRSVYSYYGTYIEQNTDDQDSVTITYPDNEATAAVYISSGVTKSSETAGSEDGALTTQEVNPIAVGSAKLASEVSNVAGQNMIVVGGPCANSVAAQLMGNPSPCNAGFEEGKAIVKLYENGDKVAMLIAGATALDTRRASRVIADFDAYEGKLSGMEVEVAGTSTTFSDTVVAAPAPKVEEPVAEEPMAEEATEEVVETVE